MIRSPVSTWAITCLISSIVLVGLAIAIFGEYARKETVSGWLAPDTGMAQIIARAGGVVEAVYVVEGDRVKEGQALAQISLDTGLTNGAGVAESMLAIIIGQRNELLERLKILKLRHETERQRLVNRREGISQELHQVAESVSLQEERIELAEEQVASLLELVDLRYSAELELQRRREDLLTQRQALAGYMQQQLELQNEMRDIESHIKSAPLVEATEISEVQVQLAELDRQRTETTTRRGYVVRAPVTGRVTTILARPGETADPDRPILTLLPEGGKLQAHLLAPTRAIGFVRPGQEVRLFYEAFPYERYGAARGTIIGVSKTIINPDYLRVNLPVQEPVYRIIVELERQTVLARGESVPLQPGMLLNADIIFDRRSIWEWMLSPILRAITA